MDTQETVVKSQIGAVSTMAGNRQIICCYYWNAYYVHNFLMFLVSGTKVTIGSVNGGIWQTADITAASPNWVFLVAELKSSSNKSYPQPSS